MNTGFPDELTLAGYEKDVTLARETCAAGGGIVRCDFCMLPVHGFQPDDAHIGGP